MVHEFEGKTEKEAIELAVKELGLERDQFDVELLDAEKAGFLSLQKKVRIKVHTQERAASESKQSYYNPNPEPENDFEKGIMEFLETMLSRMGYEATVNIMYREDKKLALRLDSEHSAIIIGRKGKNLDAIQLLANVVSNRLAQDGMKVIIDIENYRERREESLIRLAHKVGDQVIRTKQPQLLEPMNPFERRLIHTALSDIESIETISEGDGLIKQIRVSYRGLR